MRKVVMTGAGNQKQIKGGITFNVPQFGQKQEDKKA